MAYAQLTREQRYQIKVLLDTDVAQGKITEIIGVSPSTIFRELKRNSGKRGYRLNQAHEKTLARRKKKSKPHISAELWALVEEKLLEDETLASPEKIP